MGVGPSLGHRLVKDVIEVARGPCLASTEMNRTRASFCDWKLLSTLEVTVLDDGVEANQPQPGNEPAGQWSHLVAFSFSLDRAG
jgi:hypothetical protein